MQILKRFKYEILIFCFFVIVHIPYLGHDNFNTDVWKWKQRSYDFGTGVYGLQFEKTFQKYHPGVTLMWIGSTGVKISNLITGDLFKHSFLTEISQIFFLDTIQKYLLVLFIALIYTFSFYAFKQVTSLGYALVSFILLALEPFYLGLTRVFHLEGVMSTLMLGSVLWLYYYFQDITNKKRLAISAVFGALAVLTKTSALYLVPFLLLAAALFIDNKVFLALKNFSLKKMAANIKPFLSIVGLWFLLSIIAIFILWPVLWVNPSYALNGIIKGIVDVGIETDHQQFYFGKLVDDPGMFFYFVVIAYKCSVVMLLALLASLGLLLTGKTKCKKFTLYLLCYSVFYFIEITILSKKLDRYILPSIMSLSLISSYALYYLLERFAKYRYLLVGLIILSAIATYSYLNFDFLSYYNPLLGGLKTGIYVLEPKWLIGTTDILKYFDQLKKEKGYIDAPTDIPYEELIYKQNIINKVLTVGFLEKYYTQIWPFFREKNNWAVIQELRPFAVKTHYFVFPVWDDQSVAEWRFKLNLVGTISERGTPLYRVYERVL
jgi:4-amino-4-deoxy-L-arabinose transferase-like glycosyltransferase